MFLGRVRGHIVATQKDPSMHGRKLLVIEPLRVDYDDPQAAAGGATTTTTGRFGVTGRAIVAIDNVGAGEGQLVLIAQGSSARLAEGCNKTPTDAVVIGIVDETVVMGRKIT